MREKLLARGAGALADYELLEMLLFFAQPKGDTKPLAKAVINRFGSFAAVLTAPERELFATPGLGPHSVAAIKLVQASALRLARAEAMELPVLGKLGPADGLSDRRPVAREGGAVPRAVPRSQGTGCWVTRRRGAAR